MLVIQKLEKNGFFEKSCYQKSKDSLHLINEEVDFEHPEDYSYIHLAYAPLSIRLIEK